MSDEYLPQGRVFDVTLPSAALTHTAGHQTFHQTFRDEPISIVEVILFFCGI